MTTKAVAKRGETAAALPDGYLEDFPEGYDDTDHVLPVVSIVQPTSSADKKALGKEGQFVTRDGTAYDALRFVLISVQYGRGLPKPFEGHGSNPGANMWFCFSDDRRVGHPNDVEAVFGEATPDFQYDEQGRETLFCAKCPHHADNRNWVADGCRHTYTLRCWDLEANRPFAYFVRGKAMSPLRAAIIDGVTPRRANGKIIPPEHPFWWAELELTTVLKEDRGSYYLPVPRVAKVLGADEQAYYAQFYGSYRDAPVEAPEGDEGQGDLI